MHHLTPIFARLALTLLLFSLIPPARAATYYFSTGQGDDNRTAVQAQSPSTPWKTITKLNAIFSTLLPGDVILFNRGEVFEGGIVANKSGVAGNPIVFSAYGTGARPVITSFATLSGWVSLGNGIWEAPLTTEVTALNMVTINGVAYAVGRYPNANASNKGYLLMESYVNNTQFTDNELPASPNWNGAEVVIRKNRWILDRNQITSHSGTTLYYTSGSSYHAGNKHGYFIQNHPATLDSFGEWYHDKATGRLRVFFGSSGPSGHQVRASRKETGVALNNNSHLSFSNLSFQGANKKAFSVENTTGISITDAEILFSGTDAISGVNTSNFKLENASIAYTFNNAVDFSSNCPNALIRNNTINYTGYLAGMGKSGDFTYHTVYVTGAGLLVENNKIENSGYVPIRFGGNNSIVRNNLVNTHNYVKDDGGGIYTWNNAANAVVYTGQQVLNNIVLNGPGAPEGTAYPNVRLAKGIYMDDNTANVEIAGNTVSGCSKGLFIHNANQINIHDNTFFDNRDQQVLMEHDNVAPNKPIRNITFTGNILATKAPGQEMMSLRTKDNDIAQFGTFDGNYYTRTIAGSVHAVTTITGQWTSSSKTTVYNLNKWRAASGFEANAKEHQPGPHYTFNGLIGANKFINKGFDAGTNGAWTYATSGNMRGDWDNTNKLDGGSLKGYFTQVVNPAGTGTINLNIGDIDATKKYILRFSFISANADSTIKLSIMRNASPYEMVIDRSFKSTNTRKEFEFLIEPLVTVSPAILRFEMAETYGPLWIDNVEFFEADATVDPQHVVLEYNAASSAKSVSLNGISHFNGKGETKSGSISLAPYASEVLIKRPGYDPPTPCTATGTILREYWANVTGNYVSDIPLHTAPTSTSQLTSLETELNAGDSYGQRIRGYLCVPATGNYTFYIASDNTSELYLGTDDNPATKSKIASVNDWTSSREWTKYPSQQSAVIALQAGKRYYVEVLHKEGISGDHLAVGWKIPGSSTADVIPGSVLSPFVPPGCTAGGTIYREYWANVTGEHIGAIPLATAPTSTSQLTSLETVVGAADNYGQRIRGYVCAPATGNYTFYIASDNTSELYLGTDHNPTTKTKIAFVDSWTSSREWNKLPSQTSAVVALEAGKSYYVEVLHKEGLGGDNLAVGWKIAGTTTIDVIPGSVLSPFVPSARIAAAETGAEAAERLAVSPNPFDDKLTLRLGKNPDGPVTVTVTDVLGKVYHRSLIGAGDASQATLDLAGKGMRPGLYFLTARTAAGVEVIKIIRR